jgi:nitroreductase
MIIEKHGPISHRHPEHPVNPLFVDRWSPRAMSGQTVSREDLMSLFEAARWAPSSYNNQSWRFIYATRESEHWKDFLGLLIDNNRQWAEKAGALIIILSKKTFDFNQQPSKTHSFDAGAAWENLALQGFLNGLVVHGMEGFDYTKTRQLLHIPEGYDVEAMAVVGHPGDRKDLPPKLQEKESFTERKKVADIAFEGRFPADF